MPAEQSSSVHGATHISVPVDAEQLQQVAIDGRRARVALLTLIALSAAQVLLAAVSNPAPWLAVLALLLAGWKCRCIARDFMDLRHVRGPWRAVLDGWLLLVLGLLAISFLI